jgi:two-component system nitrogen regulation response regulator NtrX
MPGMDGFEVLERMKVSGAAVPVVIYSALSDAPTGFKASDRGAAAFVEKSSPGPILLQAIETQLELRKTRERLQNTEDENRTLKQTLEARYKLVGESAPLRDVTEAIRKAAPTNATVLLQGESGVGKELVARAIHRNSLRTRERFIQVNCAAIPEDLIESELFGHEKGSFTEQADRGTIFLDEVGDMSLKTQAKVLRVLQEGEVERLGSAKTAKVDVRVIAATNKHLEAEIEQGRIPIFVPPLRDRAEDIPLLVRHFVEVLSREDNLKLKRVSPSAMDALKRHKWRGNIRELRNAIERLLIMTPGDIIDVGDLPEALRAERPPRPAEPARSGGDPGTLREFKEASERAYLVEKLRENAWNISRTAEVIGTPRSNLYKKLEQYSIRQETDG